MSDFTFCGMSGKSPGAIKWPVQTADGRTIYVVSREEPNPSTGGPSDTILVGDDGKRYRLVKQGVVEPVEE